MGRFRRPRRVLRCRPTRWATARPIRYTGDRTEFLGRNGPAGPGGLRNERLSGRLGPALDPCTAIKVPVVLDADQQLDVVFRLGVGANLDDVRVAGRMWARHCAVYSRPCRTHWRRTPRLGPRETPEPAIDALITVAATRRSPAGTWPAAATTSPAGRSGSETNSKDTTCSREPDLAREHLLLCASRQFLDEVTCSTGDPPPVEEANALPDDYLWLAFARRPLRRCHR